MAVSHRHKQRLANSKLHEDQICARLRRIFPNTKVQPGSGNTAGAPNDVRVRDGFFVEAKCTEAKTISVELAWLERARKLSLPYGVPAFVALRYVGPINHDYYVVEASDFHQLLQIKAEYEALAQGGTDRACS